MPQEKKDEQPKDNGIFGNVVTPPPAPTEDPKDKKPEDKKPEANADNKPPEKFEDSPKYKEMSENMKNMRGIIEDLSGRLKDRDGKDDKKPDEKKPALEVKFSRDLPKDQYDKMSESERAMHDTMATMAQTINDLNDRLAGTETKIDTVEKNTETPTQRAAQTRALSIADGDVDKANKIIEKFNQFADNEKLSPEAFETRLKEAALLAGVKADKKETPNIQGGPVKPASKDNNGTSEVDAIVDEAAKRRTQNANGSYSL